MFRHSRILLGMAAVVIVLPACSGDEPAVEPDAQESTAPAADDDGPDEQASAAQPAEGDSCWEAQITGALEATIGDCDHFVTSWRPFEGSDLVEMNLRTSSSVLTLIDVHFPAAMIAGGVYDVAQDLGPGTSVGVDGTSFNGVGGTVTIDSQASDSSISGSFSIMAESASTGDMVTATGTFTAIPMDSA